MFVMTLPTKKTQYTYTSLRPYCTMLQIQTTNKSKQSKSNATTFSENQKYTFFKLRVKFKVLNLPFRDKMSK